MQTKVLLEKVNAMCREPVAHRGLTLWDVTFEKEGPPVSAHRGGG